MNDAQHAMQQTLTLGRFFDIRVGVHVSWLAIFGFALVSIAGSISGVSPGLAYGLAAISAVLLFASVIAHEFAHALVARRFGVQTRSITLFLFGGVALLESEPPTPGAEVAIALAGPAMSGILCGLAFGALMVLERLAAGALTDSLGLIAAYLALANGVLAVFNLVPAFPMDGGRVLRAAVWRIRRSRAAATGAASLIGLLLAAALVIGGAVATFALQSWRSGWYVLIGAFLLRQGWQQFRESRIAERLERVCVRDVMDAAADGDVASDEFSLASSASALEAVSAFRASERVRIAVVDAGQLAGWLQRDRTLANLDRAA